jgi:hypothetical protein
LSRCFHPWSLPDPPNCSSRVQDGTLDTSEVMSAGKPAELCWLSVSPDALRAVEFDFLGARRSSRVRTAASSISLSLLS